MFEFYASALGISAFVAGGISTLLYRNMRRFHPPAPMTELPLEVDLPSVTVCIPARNEAHALADCLEKVLASEYEKLEIIVLDDVSGDDTSALIKSFASEGVRFVKGAPLAEGWVGKNHALQGLLGEASGSYVLFIDVDTHVSPRAIESMVRYAITKRSAMLSVLPYRADGWRASVLFSPLRYFWEVVMSSDVQPASASSAWLIQRKVLTERLNGFHAMKAAVQPEALIAATLSKTKEYSFLMSDTVLGVAYEKKWRSQLITSIRLLYPLCRKNGFIVLLLILLLAMMLLPYGILTVGIMQQTFTETHWVALAIAIVLSGTYAYYTSRVWAKGSLFSVFLFPIVLVQEILLICASFVQYKRKTVRWKGRPIQTEVQS